MGIFKLKPLRCRSCRRRFYKYIPPGDAGEPAARN